MLPQQPEKKSYGTNEFVKWWTWDKNANKEAKEEFDR